MNEKGIEEILYDAKIKSEIIRFLERRMEDLTEEINNKEGLLIKSLMIKYYKNLLQEIKKSPTDKEETQLEVSDD